MEIFMNAMEWVTRSGFYKVMLLGGLAVILIGLFRAFGTRILTMGQSALSALWLVSLVVLLMCIAPVSTAAGWMAQSIPYVGDLMDYGSIIGMLEHNPMGALINFVDCYLLMAMSGLIEKPFSGIKNIVSKVLMSIVIMLVCIFALEWVKSLDWYQKMETFIYALSGGVLVFAVVGLIAVMRYGGGVLPPIMSLMPDFLVKPLYITSYYVMILTVLDLAGFDLRLAAKTVVSIGGAFAPAAVAIAGLGILLFGVLK